MPNPNANPSSNANSEQRGFSLVELLVALLFTSILMAGMAKVFQSSLGVFVASSETISSGRRNRMAMDLLYDDLNKAGMVPSTLFWYPAVNITLNPPFQVTPNVSYDPTSKTDVAAALAKADMLDFFYDEILPYDATLSTELLNTSQQVALGGATTVSYTHLTLPTILRV